MLKSKKLRLITLSALIAVTCLPSCVTAKLKSEIVSEVKQSIEAYVDTKINTNIGLINDNSVTWNDIKPWIWIIGIIFTCVTVIIVAILVNNRKSKETDAQENIALSEHKQCHDSEQSTKIR